MCHLAFFSISVSLLLFFLSLIYLLFRVTREENSNATRIRAIIFSIRVLALTFAWVVIEADPLPVTALRQLAICTAFSGLDGIDIFEMASTNFSLTCEKEILHDNYIQII